MAVLLALALLLAPHPRQLAAAAVTTPLGSWISGIATNYGSAYDKTNPYDGSWGTSDVRPGQKLAPSVIT